MTTSKHISIGPVAGSVPFDNSTNGFTSTDTQAAIEEVKALVSTSASPGFSYGRSGISSGGTYMQCETVPSNVSGRWVYVSGAEVVSVSVTNELTTTYSMTVSYHNGNGAGETTLGTVTVTGAKGATIPVSWSVPINTQLAVRVANATANSPKNVVVVLQLQGSL
jgi:hypothetical protein